MHKVVADFTVIRNTPLNGSTHVLELQSPSPMLALLPGQFVNVEIPGNKEVFLRRPFSVFDADPKANRLSLLVKILGKGSATLAGMAAGATLSLIYPLGKGFTLPVKGDRVLAVGGGSGVAPLLFLARHAALSPGNMKVILGSKTSSEQIDVQKYTDCATIGFTTEDGSYGEKGWVTHHSWFATPEQFDRIYACGPLPMMKAIAAIAKAHHLFCEVSLENLMACGFGVCLCCIEPTVKGNLSVCTEGPVFNIEELTW